MLQSFPPPFASSPPQMTAITNAIDFPKLKEVARSLYTSALACLASANSVTVRKLSLGFDLGNILGSDIDHITNFVLTKYNAQEYYKVF